MASEVQKNPHPWNQGLLDNLRGLMVSGLAPHAIALTSREGWGEEQLLKLVGNLFLKLPENTETQSIVRGDLFWISPDGSVIKIDQIRQAIEFAYQTNSNNDCKVIAIEQGHLLNLSATNALLKIVEEPPPGTVILLQTTQWGILPATLRSRFQNFSPGLSTSIAKTWLAQMDKSISDDQFAESGYSPMGALDYEAQGFSPTLEQVNDMKINDVVDELLKLQIVVWLGNWYRFILGRLAGCESKTVNADLKKVFIFCDELARSRKEISSSNSANTRLIVERLIILWRQQKINSIIPGR